MLDKIDFQLNQKISLYYKNEIVEVTFKGKVTSLYYSNITDTLTSCFLIEVGKDMLRIAEPELLQAYNEAWEKRLDDIPF